MGKVVYLDTHVVAWLYAGDLELVPAHARAVMATGELLVSPMAALELEYLYETEKLKAKAEQIIQTLSRDIGLRICDADFPGIVRHALRQTWTRDPFDRIITAQAEKAKASLVTKDETIHKHYKHAVWD
jgi:PIN domain nuclease of toxin-antitoxin system